MMATNNEQYLQEVMDLFMARYQPVNDIKEASHFLSTGEIHTEISRLNPGSNVKPEQIYDLMRQAGFRFDIEKDYFSLRFKWMLRQK